MSDRPGPDEELSALRDEVAHLQQRLVASEVVEAQLLRERADRRRSDDERDALRTRQADLEARLEEVRRELAERRRELREASSRADGERRRRELAERRLTDLETSRSLRIGRAVTRLARLGRAGDPTPSGGGGPSPGGSPPGGSSPAPAASPTAPAPTTGLPDTDPPAGVVVERGDRRAAVVLHVAIAVPEEAVLAALDAIDIDDDRAVLVTDVDRFDEYRARDLVVEYVPPLDELRRTFGGAALEVRDARLAELARLHAPRETRYLDPDAPTPAWRTDRPDGGSAT